MKPLRDDSDAAIDLAASRWIARRDSGMSAADEAAFAAWLAADPRHMRAFARHEQTWRSFDRPLAAGRADAMVEALAQSAATRKRRRTRRLAAGLAVCLLGGMLWQQASLRAPREIAGSTASAVVRVPEKRTLPDGSLLELPPGAAVQVAFTPAERRIVLQHGEAFFNVAKSPVPFVVSAHGVDVRAIGTAFSVQLGAQAVEVLVTHGIVEVNRATDDPNATRAVEPTPGGSPASSPAASLPAAPAPLEPAIAPVRVGAGNRVAVKLATQIEAPLVTAIAAPELAERLAWRKTRLEFTDTPLAVAADLFNRHTRPGEGHRLVVDPRDVTLSQLEVTGYFDADNVGAFVHLIEQTLGVTAERQRGEIVLRRAR